MINPNSLNGDQRRELSSCLADMSQRIGTIENALDPLDRDGLDSAERHDLREEIADQVDELLGECETLRRFERAWS